MRRRAVIAIVIAATGAATCIASDYVFGASEPYGTTIGVPWDLLIAIPFGLLSLLVLVTGMSIVVALVVAVGLATLTVFSYHAANTDSSSTAGLALLGPWSTGIPLVVAAWIVDAAVRGLRGRRGYAREM
jgi:hypothetical protein